MDVDEPVQGESKKSRKASTQHYALQMCCPDNGVYWQQVETRKQIWLVTYGAACDSITHEMLKGSGINTDECYTIAWRESKYTLFHCPKTDRVSMEAMKLATKVMKDRHQIVFNAAVFGYDALSSNDTSNGESLENHPGFKKMVQLLNAGSKDLQWWIQGDGSSICEYRKGMLWKYIDSTDPEKMTHGQLVSRVKAWAPLAKMHDTLQEAYNSTSARLQALEEELQKLKMELKAEREISAKLSDHIKELFEEKALIRNQLVDAGLRPLDMPSDTACDQE